LRYEGKASLDWFLNGWINGTSFPAGVAECQIRNEGNATTVTGAIRQEYGPEDLVTSVPIYAVVAGKAPVLAAGCLPMVSSLRFGYLCPGTHKLLLDPNGPY